MEKKEKASAEALQKLCRSDIRSKRTENDESDFNFNLIVKFLFYYDTSLILLYY
jgi:hypothetical protein